MKAKRVSCLVLSVCAVSWSIFDLEAASAAKQQVSKELKTNIDIGELHYLTAEEKEKIAKNGLLPRK